MRVTHAATEPTIGEPEWNADHVIENEAHVHDYADPAHIHDTSHNHNGIYAAPHGHPYSSDIHDHSGTYEPVHAHPYSSSAHNHDASYAALHAHPYSADDHTHSLSDGDIPAAIARDAEVTSAIASHAATPHGGGSEAFPVGSVFLSVVATNPATLLGYGTWAAFGAGRMLVGNDGGTFGTDEATGGASTHSHAAHSGVLSHTHAVTDPGHVHDEYRNSATTGGLDGWAAGDTSTNNPLITGYDTGSKVTGLTVNSAGSGSEYTHDSPSHLPPYTVVRMWKRTA
jgi:hypothetical protein